MVCLYKMPKRKNPEFDPDEYHKLLAELFPSKYAIEQNSIKESSIRKIKDDLDYIFKYIDNAKLKNIQKIYKLVNEDSLKFDKIYLEYSKTEHIISALLHEKHAENVKIYTRLLSTNYDDEYFKKLPPADQEHILSQLQLLQNDKRGTKPYIIQILESNMPDNFKRIGLLKIAQLNELENSERGKLLNWLTLFLKLPFNKSAYLPVTIKDGIEACQNYMVTCEAILNDCVYGMNEAKGQIMQLIGKWITNPESIGTAIGLKGPMGTGKTTLVKYGISKILNRELAFITLGGSADGTTLKGHSYTYEGSGPGKIADILIQCKTSNPIIFFDELDKVSQTDKGQEIYSVLTHLTDVTQNNQFHDNFFSELDLDLSKCLFIFSYNDETLINPILKDRMYTIEIAGYNTTDKINICEKYLIPGIEKDIGINPGDIVISSEIIKYIIEKTKHEDGVRNLKRNMETIYSKLNLFHIMKHTTIFKNIIHVTFPFVLNTKIIDQLITLYNNSVPINSSMYI
jgi:ATP-dependent Lon protease